MMNDTPILTTFGSLISTAISQNINPRILSHHCLFIIPTKQNHQMLPNKNHNPKIVIYKFIKKELEEVTQQLKEND
jgi:hypothetical protein